MDKTDIDRVFAVLAAQGFHYHFFADRNMLYAWIESHLGPGQHEAAQSSQAELEWVDIAACRFADSGKSLEVSAAVTLLDYRKEIYRTTGVNERYPEPDPYDNPRPLDTAPGDRRTVITCHPTIAARADFMSRPCLLVPPSQVAVLTRVFARKHEAEDKQKALAAEEAEREAVKARAETAAVEDAEQAGDEEARRREGLRRMTPEASCKLRSLVCSTPGVRIFLVHPPASHYPSTWPVSKGRAVYLGRAPVFTYVGIPRDDVEEADAQGGPLLSFQRIFPPHTPGDLLGASENGELSFGGCKDGDDQEMLILRNFWDFLSCEQGVAERGNNTGLAADVRVSLVPCQLTQSLVKMVHPRAAAQKDDGEKAASVDDAGGADDVDAVKEVDGAGDVDHVGSGLVQATQSGKEEAEFVEDDDDEGGIPLIPGNYF